MTTAMTRLHITPFTPDLSISILGPEAAKFAENISYHSLDTFPEQSYGYVSLPEMEAEKIKKKLHGAILKGKKMKVQDARPNKRKYPPDIGAGIQEEEESTERITRQSKKSKNDADVIQGHLLSPDRKVKRGWTEPATEKSKKRRKDKTSSDAKTQATSKFSEKEELLFRAKIPKNKVSHLESSEKKRKAKNSKSDVVHEFAKSTKMPSFLRSEASAKQSASTYEDGKGWVDEDGAIVEQEHIKTSKRRKAATHGIEHDVMQAQPKKKTLRSQSDPTASATVSEEDTRLATDVLDDEVQSLLSGSSSDSVVEETSSSGSSSSDSETDTKSSSSQDEDEIAHSDTMETPPPASSMHPLEALFKKPSKPASSQSAIHSQDVVKPSLEIQTSFSFFNGDDDDDIPPILMTPFSSQDVRHRELRSAAPTPDTAHPSRMNSIFNGEESDGELSEMDDSLDRDEVGPSGQPRTSASQSLPIPQTDFEKQFWEKRGENNRAWKARRKAVLKEKRQRENRARRPKNW